MSVRIVYPDGEVAGPGRGAMNAHFEAFYVDATPPLPKGPMSVTFAWALGGVAATTV